MDPFAAFDARLVSGRMSPVPVFDVNLNDPPEVRWAWITQYADHFKSARQLILGEVGIDADEPTPLWVTASARVMLMAVPSDRRHELEACAALCGVPAGELALLNYLYELKAKCSSFVVARPDGRPLHARTLDWPGCAVLCACTVNVRVSRGQRLLYESLTWPGYLGVLTACAPGRFSLSVNFRADERAQLPWELPGEGTARTILSEILRRGVAMLGSLTGKCRSVGFAVRHLLEAEPAISFEGALEKLSGVALVAPVFFTLCGTASDEGAILVRGPSPIAYPPDEGDKWRLRRLGDPACTLNGLLYQANADLPVNATARSIAQLKRAEGQGGLVSWDRICKAQKLALKYGPRFTLADVIDMITTAPIANEITIFSSVLDPAAAPGDVHVHCGRHNEFEEVENEDGSRVQEIVLPVQKKGNAWRAALGGNPGHGAGRGAGQGGGQGRGGRGISKRGRSRGK